MSYSDIVGTISGLLQFVVACYALRVSRIYGLARVGWMFFGAFTLLAVVHVLLSVHPFGVNLELGASVNLFYEIISVLLLGTIFQAEVLLWNRRKQVNAEQQARAQEEAKAKEQVAQLTKSTEEFKQTASRLQAEAAQHQQALKQVQEQAEKSLQEQQLAAQQSREALRETIVRLEAEIASQQQALTQALAQSQEDKGNALQDELAATRQLEEEWRATAGMLQSELAQMKLAMDQAEQVFQGQLAAVRQSEAEWRATAARLQAEVSRPAPAPEITAAPVSTPAPAPAPAPMESVPEPIVQAEPQVEAAPSDPLTILRQSGIAEVAIMTQSRVAYIARIARLMREHSRDLGKFMTRTPQGRQLPHSLMLLIEYLSDEQFLLLRRIDSVKKKLEQFKPNGTVPAIRTQPAAEVRFQEPAEPAKEIFPGPAPEAAMPIESGTGSGDFREHLLSSVTETGTELTPHVTDADAAEKAVDTVLSDTDARA